MVPRWARHFAPPALLRAGPAGSFPLDHASKAAQIVQERIATRAPAPRGRVRDTDTLSAPTSSLLPNGALSRLRRYMLGNCTFVTFWRWSNQHPGAGRRSFTDHD